MVVFLYNILIDIHINLENYIPIYLFFTNLTANKLTAIINANYIFLIIFFACLTETGATCSFTFLSTLSTTA